MAPLVRLEVHSPQGRRSTVAAPGPAGRSLADVLRQIDLPLNTRCGQRGLCDGCLVQLLEGRLVESSSGQLVSASSQPVAWRACQVCLPPDGHAEIRIPARSLLAHQPQVVTFFRINVPRSHDPLWQRVRPTRDTLSPDLPPADAICRAVARMHAGKSPWQADLSGLPARCVDSSDCEVTIERQGSHWRVRPAPHDVADPRVYGAAIDVGTTTVVVLLVDLETGTIVSEASALNAQTDLGDNVLTRINVCMTDHQMVGSLQEAVVRKTLGPLLGQTLSEAGASPHQLVCMTVAGNTTMLHLFGGVDPTSMGMAPFTPTFLDHRVIPARELPWHTPADARPQPAMDRGESDGGAPTGFQPGPDDTTVHLLPGAAAYVGADVVAGVFSSGMAYASQTCLLVDIGTNGEIVLRHGDRMTGCATAAGPAFEGAGLRCGMRAGKGAISHVRLRLDPPQLETDVIGGGKPIGICGTAYVDFVAQTRLAGLIGATGRFVKDSFGDWHVEETEHGRSITIAHGRGKEPIFITEGDIAVLLQAKAAIAAGIVCLLERAGIKSEDVTTLYLAGGFGFHMQVENAIDFGLLPGFHPSQVELVGNTSLAGAYLALLDSGVLDEIGRIGANLETIELNLDPRFESEYIDQLFLAVANTKRNR